MSYKNNTKTYTYHSAAEEEFELHTIKCERLIPAQDKLVIHTTPGQKVVEGRKDRNNYGPIGLKEFCNRMAAVYSASAYDDPYADQLLLNIYNECIKLRRYISKVEEEYLRKLKEVEGLELTVREAIKPVTYNISFKTPYGYLIAYLLIDFDRFCRAIISAKMAALMPEKFDIQKTLLDLRKRIRRILSEPLKWHYTGVMRPDVEAQNKLANEAKKVNQFTVESHVFSKEKRAPYAPRIRDFIKEIMMELDAELSGETLNVR